MHHALDNKFTIKRQGGKVAFLMIVDDKVRVMGDTRLASLFADPDGVDLTHGTITFKPKQWLLPYLLLRDGSRVVVSSTCFDDVKRALAEHRQAAGDCLKTLRRTILRAYLLDKFKCIGTLNSCVIYPLFPLCTGEVYVWAHEVISTVCLVFMRLFVRYNSSGAL